MASAGQPDTCGACIAFLPEREEEGVSVGRCRLRPEMGQIAATLPRCPKYVERGTGKTYHTKKAVRGRARGWYDDTEVIVEGGAPKPPRAGASGEGRTASASPATPRPRAYGPTIDLGDENMDTEALRALIKDVLLEEGVIGIPQMADKWQGGTMSLNPADPELKPKEIPIDALFHKVVMVRDRLRVLEQKVNSSPNLSDQEKVDMQSYITRAYGSLTTFNVLFKDKRDHFVGAKG